MSEKPSNYYANSPLPFHINYYSLTPSKNSESYWHSDIEIVFALTGQTDIFVEDKHFLLNEEDIFLINSNDYHTFQTSHASSLLAFRLSPERLPYFSGTSNLRFNINSIGNTNSPRFDYIKYLLAQFVKLNETGEHIYKSLSIIFSLYSHMVENFMAPPIEAPTIARKSREKISEINDYIEKHYTECLTLNKVASAFSYSSPYFASFFEKNTGKTFLTHYNDIRLKHCINDLLTSPDSIEDIALANGFSDVRGFVSIFKKKYGTVPSKYRKEHRTSNEYINFNMPATFQEATNDQKEAILKGIASPSLMKYLNIYNSGKPQMSFISNNIKTIDAGIISNVAKTTDLKHTFKTLMNVGSARQILYGEVQEMISLAQKDISFKYIKFHGILSDEMMVYSEDSEGNPEFSFTLIDKVFDFLISVGLKPFVELSFMPGALASDPDRLMNFNKFNTSPPKDLKKWSLLIAAFISHIISRYGSSTVESWLFTLWNEPDGTVAEFEFPTKEEFFEFYEITYKTIKAINKKIVFGTPSLLFGAVETEGWARDYYIFCNEHDCRPEFLNFHYYDNTILDDDDSLKEKTGFSNDNIATFFPMHTDQYSFMKFINKIKSLRKRFNMKTMPIYLSEWNLTISHRDLINDTCFKSCYITKNLLENYDRLDSFGYWVLTDFIEELQLPNELYHGGLGLFTYNGIPKAHYNAFKFLNSIKNNLVAQGDGYFITKEDASYSIIIYNYEHFSKTFASGYRSEADLTNRYASFRLMENGQFTMKLTDIDDKYKRILIKERFINQSNGSSYDAWVKIGAQPLSRDEDYEILKEQSQPGMLLRQGEIVNNEFLLQAQLAPLEVRLIEMTLD